MRNIFDLSLIDGVLSNVSNGSELECKIKEEVKNKTKYASFRERFFYIPISGNSLNPCAFEFLECYISLHLKRVFSNKTWKPIRDIYTIEAYRIHHGKRTSVYDEFKITEYKKSLTSCLSDIEEVDSMGKAL